MRSKKGQMLEIWAPEWFADPDFAAFVQKFSNPPEQGPRLATWHTGPEVHENSDVFILIDNYEAQESDMPEKFMELIECEARSCRMKHGIAWIKNFEGDEDEPTLRSDPNKWVARHRTQLLRIIADAEMGITRGWDTVFNCMGHIAVLRVTCEKGYIHVDEDFNVSTGEFEAFPDGV